jgi:hypothetical protein
MKGNYSKSSIEKCGISTELSIRMPEFTKLGGNPHGMNH